MKTPILVATALGAAIFLSAPFLWLRVQEFPISHDLQLTLRKGDERTLEFPESSEWIYLKGTVTPSGSARANPFPSSYLKGGASEIVMDESGNFRADGKFERLTLKALSQDSFVSVRAWTLAENRNVKRGAAVLLVILLAFTPAIFFLLSSILDRSTRDREQSAPGGLLRTWLGTVVLLAVIVLEIFFSWTQGHDHGPMTREYAGERFGEFLVLHGFGFAVFAGILGLAAREGRPLAGVMRVRFLWRDFSLGLIAIPAVMGIHSLAQSLLGAQANGPQDLQGSLPVQEILGPYTLSVFFFAIVEEILYRGYLATRIGVLVGKPVAGALIANFLFALTHIEQGPAAVLGFFLVGLVWSALAIWRGNLMPAIVSHGAWNLTFAVLGLHSPSRFF